MREEASEIVDTAPRENERREVKRDAHGRLMKGSAGLPNAGRPVQKIKDLAEYTRIMTENGTLAVQGILSIAQDPKAKHADRLRAWEILQDRGYGKAVDVQVMLALTNDPTHKDALAHYSTVTLERLLRQLAPGSADVIDAEVTVGATDCSSVAVDPKPK